MALKINLKASPPTHDLQAWRYCAGMGVAYLLMPLAIADEANVKVFQEITDWLSGPEVVIGTDEPITDSYFAENIQQLSDVALLKYAAPNRSLFVEVSLANWKAAYTPSPNTLNFILKAKQAEWLAFDREQLMGKKSLFWAEFTDVLPADLPTWLEGSGLYGISLTSAQSTFDSLLDLLPALESDF